MPIRHQTCSDSSCLSFIHGIMKTSSSIWMQATIKLKLNSLQFNWQIWGKEDRQILTVGTTLPQPPVQKTPATGRCDVRMLTVTSISLSFLWWWMAWTLYSHYTNVLHTYLTNRALNSHLEGMRFISRQSYCLMVEAFHGFYPSSQTASCLLFMTIMPSCMTLRGCIQKFQDWPPGARTVNGTTLCH